MKSQFDIPIGWTPQPGPQEAFCRSSEFEVFLGGSAGGGKSDALLMEGCRYIWHPQYRAIIFRRTTPQLGKLIDRSEELFPRMFPGCVLKDTKRHGLHWLFQSGARFNLGHMENEKDKYKHDGKEYHYIGFDELQHFLHSQYKYMYSRARSTVPEIKPRIRSTGMPIGIGIVWVKDRFIIHGPNKVIVDEESDPNDPNPPTRRFIPANLDDNPILTSADPQYEKLLRLMGSKLYHALRHGDWDSIEGASFEELNKEDHSKPPHEPPKGTPVYRCLDWGYAKPFSVGWYYLDNDKNLIRFKEWYGYGGEPDKGLRMESRDVARKILEIDERYDVAYGVADPSIWSKEDGPSIAENMRDEGCDWRPAINDRVNGKIEFHTRLQGEDDIPFFYVTEDCHHWWRTVPMLQAAPNRAEDCDTKMEDHCLHGDTLVMTDRGEIPIRELVGKTGRLKSVNGLEVDFRNCRLTRKDAEVVRVVYEDGREVVCTPDHKFLTKQGWIEAKDLLMNFPAIRKSYDINKKFKLYGYATPYGERIGKIPLLKGNLTMMKGVRIKKVESAGRGDVYCLSADVFNSFAINGGILVANCYDESRYMMMNFPIHKGTTEIWTGDIRTTANQDF